MKGLVVVCPLLVTNSYGKQCEGMQRARPETERHLDPFVRQTIDIIEFRKWGCGQELKLNELNESYRSLAKNAILREENESYHARMCCSGKKGSYSEIDTSICDLVCALQDFDLLGSIK